jgi:hypothetical protein
VVKVVDSNVAPPALPPAIGGATVIVLPPGGGAQQSAKTRDASDKAHGGEARFEKLPAGAATIRVQASGFALGNSQATLKAGETTTVEVPLQPASGIVVVSVTDDLGAAVDDKDVLVTLQPPGSAKALTAPTKSGKARFEKVPPGKCKIIAAKPGFADGENSADVLADQTVETPVQLTRQLGDLTVTVTTPDGALLKEAVVALDGKDHREAKTADSGDATMKDVPIGNWKVSARLDNFTAPAPEQIQIKAGAQKKTIVLTPAAITPEILPAALTVLVKKRGCDPARKEVLLHVTGGNLTGNATGKFTRTGDTVKFFTFGGKEITDTANNVFPAADLNKGVKILAEGVKASASLDAKDLAELKLELFVGSNAFGKPVTAKLTVVELTLDLFQSRTAAAGDPAAMTANDKVDKGRFIHVQDPGFHHGRAMMVVREVKPAGFKQDLVLQAIPAKAGTTPGVAQVFNAEKRPPAGDAALGAVTVKAADLAAAPTVAGAKGLAFFAEGQKVSAKLQDTGFQLGISGDERDGDRATLTVVVLSKLEAIIPSTKALVDRTAAGFTNSPVPDTKVTKGAGAALVAADFDESYAANPPIVLIENSIAAGTPIALSVVVKPDKVPVLWSALRDTRPAAAAEGGGDAADVIAPQGPAPKALPSLTQLAADPLKATLLTDAAGSFRVRAYVDGNDNKAFDRDPVAETSFSAEPFILMNYVMVRVIGVSNTSVGNNGANLAFTQAGTATPPVGNQPVQVVTGTMASGATAAMHNIATVNVIGGGSDGLRGLNRVFSAWLQNMQRTAGSRSPVDCFDLGADYEQTVLGVVQRHQQFWMAAKPPLQTYLPGGAAPVRLPFPMLDVTAFANAGQGGVLPCGMGAPGPNALAKVAIPPAAPGGTAPHGQQWTVEMWDIPGIGTFPNTHPGFPAAQMVRFTHNDDFRSDLVFWTNNNPAAAPLGMPTPGIINAPGSGPPDPACCLYATVQTNTWNVRCEATFAKAAPFVATIVQPLRVNMFPDANPTRLAAPLANMETRFPGFTSVFGLDART